MSRHIIRYLIQISPGANKFEIYKRVSQLKLIDWNTNYGRSTNYWTYMAIFENSREYNEYLKCESISNNVEIFERQSFLKYCNYRYKGL